MSEESSTPTTHCPNCKKIASSCGGGGEAANEGYANCLACDVTWEADASTRDEIVRLWRAGALAGDGRIASYARPLTTEEIDRIKNETSVSAAGLIPRLLATIAERDKALDDATVMLDVSNRQLAEIRSMVGDGPAAEAVRRALAEKDAEVDRCNRMMDHYRATIRESLELVSACDGEPLPDAISRGLRELFELTRTEMEKMATFAVDSIEENMRVGAKGMRDACAQIAGALSTSPNAFVAATSTGIRKAIEALPLP